MDIQSLLKMISVLVSVFEGHGQKFMGAARRSSSLEDHLHYLSSPSGLKHV